MARRGSADSSSSDYGTTLQVQALVHDGERMQKRIKPLVNYDLIETEIEYLNRLNINDKVTKQNNTHKATENTNDIDLIDYDYQFRAEEQYSNNKITKKNEPFTNWSVIGIQEKKSNKKAYEKNIGKARNKKNYVDSDENDLDYPFRSKNRKKPKIVKANELDIPSISSRTRNKTGLKSVKNYETFNQVFNEFDFRDKKVMPKKRRKKRCLIDDERNNAEKMFDVLTGSNLNDNEQPTNRMKTQESDQYKSNKIINPLTAFKTNKRLRKYVQPSFIRNSDSSDSDTFLKETIKAISIDNSFLCSTKLSDKNANNKRPAEKRGIAEFNSNILFDEVVDKTHLPTILSSDDAEIIVSYSEAKKFKTESEVIHNNSDCETVEEHKEKEFFVISDDSDKYSKSNHESFTKDTATKTSENKLTTFVYSNNEIQPIENLFNKSDVSAAEINENVGIVMGSSCKSITVQSDPDTFFVVSNENVQTGGDLTSITNTVNQTNAEPKGVLKNILCYKIINNNKINNVETHSVFNAKEEYYGNIIERMIHINQLNSFKNQNGKSSESGDTF